MLQPKKTRVHSRYRLLALVCLVAWILTTSANATDLTIQIRDSDAKVAVLSNGDSTTVANGLLEVRVRSSEPVARFRLIGSGEGCSVGRLEDVSNGDDPGTANDDDPSRRFTQADFLLSMRADEVCNLKGVVWLENYRWAGHLNTTVNTGITADQPPLPPPDYRYAITQGTASSAPMNTDSPSGAGSSHGTRVYCVSSHFAYDDPIVHPGELGVAHLHLFWGNTAANAATTAQSLQTRGQASCEGGLNNRTSYWAPALFDAAGQATIPESIFVYYKSFGGASFDRQTIQPIPNGLQMLANRQVDNVYAPGAFRVGSLDGNLRLSVRFPNCLQVDGNGQPVLSSDNNTSHLSYASGTSENPSQCPDSHPYRIPQVSYIITYAVPLNSEWRLASDMNGPKGESLHADYFAAWDEDTMNRIVRCNIESRRNCQFVQSAENGQQRSRTQLPARFLSPSGVPVYSSSTELSPNTDRTPFGNQLTPMRQM